MTRLARFPLAVTITLLLACHGDRPLMPPVGAPSAMISDGTHADGNPDFFFLEPISDPAADPDFGDRAFNAGLLPVVDVCELSGDPLGASDVSCVTTVFGPVAAAVSASDEQYHANWHTDESNGGAGLNDTKFYRIQAFGSTGGALLGFADVDPVSTGKELKHLQTGEVVGLVDGRTLPIKFRVEEAALCDPPGTDPCSSKTIALADGGTVVLEETGDRIDIPPQNSSQVTTVSVQVCDGLDVDAPRFGNCLTITADPPLAGPLAPSATVSVCSILQDEALLALAHDQQHLVTLYRQDDDLVVALPHADDFCDASIGSAPGNWVQQLARALGRLLAPRPLHATVALLNVGEGGDTDSFSDFQLVLPVKMETLVDQMQTAAPGDAVAQPPAVRVFDRNGDPVAGATVRFAVTAGGGTISSTTCDTGDALLLCASVPVVTDEAGMAAAGVDAWVLGDAGTNTVRAFGRGIAAGEDGPFMPDNIDAETGEPIPSEMQETVPVGTGEVLFSATAESAVEGTWVETVGQLPDGRRDHSATLLENGDVLIIGGTASGAFLYHPESGAFTATEGSPVFGHSQGMTATKLLDGRVLTVGGGGAGFRAQIYDPSNGTFAETAHQPTASRVAHSATLLTDGRVLLAGGQFPADGGPQSHPNAEIFDPGDETFTPVGDLNHHRYGHAATLLPDGRVLIVGGSQTVTPGSANCLAAAELFDPGAGDGSGAFTVTAGSLAEPRCALAFTGAPLLANGLVLVIGWFADGAELFDPTTETFSATDDMSIDRTAPSATVLSDGRVLVAGGTASSVSVLRSAEIYDPTLGVFTPAHDLITGRLQHTGTRLPDGRVLVVGGSGADGDLKSAELFSVSPPIF